MIVEAILDVSSGWRPRVRYALDFLAQATGIPIRVVDASTASDSILLFYGEPSTIAAAPIPPTISGAPRVAILIPATGDGADDSALLTHAAALSGLPGLPGDPPTPIFGPVLSNAIATPLATDKPTNDDRARRTLLQFDLIANIFVHLSRLEETIAHERDRFGRFPSASSVLAQHRALHTPVVDRLAALFLELVRREQLAAGGALARIAHWPSGEPCAVALTHDVDQSLSWPRQFARGLAAVARALPRGGGANGAPSRRTAFARALRSLSRERRDPLLFSRRVRDYERAEGVSSSWFFLTVPSDSEGRRYNVESRAFRRFLRELHAQGFEVGLHGSIQSAASAHAMTNERRMIEHVLGARVESNRQHYLVFSASGSFWDLREAGIQYDSSIGYSDATGFRAGTSLPFRPFDHARDEAVALLEVPLAMMDVARIQPADASVALDPLWRELLDRSAVLGGLVTILWHPRMFDSDTHPAGRAPYESFVRMAKARALPFLRVTDAARWWRAREGVAFHACETRAGATTLRYSTNEALERLTIVVDRAPTGDGARVEPNVSVRGGNLVARSGNASRLAITLGGLRAASDFEVVID
ncbi:MAG: polysaccharide deacetylase family protein [bacterium]